MVFGDQKTRSFLSHYIHLRADAVDLLHTSCGVMPVIADFHAQFHIGDIITDVINPTKFIPENDPKNCRGTFASLIQATERQKKIKPLWKDGFEHNERFLNDALSAYICGFAMKRFGMGTMTDLPTKNLPTFTWNTATKTAKQVWFNQQMAGLVEDTWTWKFDPRQSTPPPLSRQNIEPSYRCPKQCGLKRFNNFKAYQTHTAKCTYNGSPVALADEAEHKHDRVCPNGCGFAHSLQYGRIMTDHLKSCEFKGTASTSSNMGPKDDDVYNYTLRAFNLMMWFWVFRDAIRFGNGSFVVDMFKWIFILSRTRSDHSKYAGEAIFLRACVKVLLSEQMAHRLTWDRFTCAHNEARYNILIDQRLEHVNCPTKELMDHIGFQNLTAKQIDAIGRGVCPCMMRVVILMLSTTFRVLVCVATAQKC